MAETKYGKYFTHNMIREGELPPRIKFNSQKEFGAGNFGMRYTYVSEPFEIPESPHAHDFDQFLCFFATGDDFKDFGAEVELYLGAEGEKHVITESTVVYVPKGLIHCPLRFTKINKPIMFINAVLSPRYAQVEGTE